MKETKKIKMRKEVYDIIERYKHLVIYGDELQFENGCTAFNIDKNKIPYWASHLRFDTFYEGKRVKESFWSYKIIHIPKFTDEEMIFIYNSIKNNILNRERIKQEKLKNTLSKFNLTLEDFNNLKEALNIN